MVLITDTWLHFTTKTVNFVQTSANSEQPNHSFRLVDRCTDVNITYFGGCSLDQAAAGAFLINGSTSLAVLSNVSQTTAVITHENHGRQFAYLGVAPQLQLADIDFTAKSWALETECKPVTSKCIDDQRIYGAATPYKCPFAFEGLLMTPNANVMTTAYFTNSTASDNSTHSVSLENPYYFASITKVNRNIGVSKALGSDPEISIAVHGGVLSVLFCNTTVYDLEYSLVNGSVTRFLTTPSNSSMANLFQGGQQYTKVGDPTLIQAASIAALGDTAQNLADSFALSYSQTALAVSAGIFVPEEVIESQHRQNILVAKVPKAPLMSLIAANLLLVVLGIVLTVIAFISLQGETGEIQARLSIAALVAAHFEGDRSKKPVEHVDDIFEERDGLPGPRIGFAKTDEDTWTFTSWRP